MSDEWIYGCGVRFWGHAQVTEAIWAGWVGGLILGLLALIGLVVGFHVFVKAHDWTDRLIGVVVFLMSVLLLFAPANLITDAVCYGGI